MIGCDMCPEWYHAKCVNVSKAEAEASKQWKCPDCVKQEAAGGKAAGEGRKRANKNGKNGKLRKVVEGSAEEDMTDRDTNGATQNKENSPVVKEEKREDDLTGLGEVGGSGELGRAEAGHGREVESAGSAVKGAKSDKSRDRDRPAGGKNGKEQAMGVKSEKLDKLAKTKRKRDREDRRDKSAASDRERKREGKRLDKEGAAYGGSGTTNGLVSGKRRHRDEEDGKKRRRVDREDGMRHADSNSHGHSSKSERRRERDRSLTISGALSESEASEAEDARYSWLDKDERDSSSGEEDVYLTSDDEAAEAEADDADVDGILMARYESPNFDDWKRGGLSQRKAMLEDEETALEELCVKQPVDADEQPELVPFGSISLRARTLLSPFSMIAGENTREVFLSALLPENDPAALSPSSSSASLSASSSIESSASPSSSSSSAADFTMSSPPSVDDLDHLHLHRLHNAKMRVECELLRLEQDRRVYLAGVDYSARMSVMRTMEAFDRRATESVLLEEVEVDEESAKEKERERERLEAEAAGKGGAGVSAADVMSSPRVVFPFTPRPPSLSRRPSTNSLTSLPPLSLASDSISPPLYGTTLTCCGCDGLIPAAIYPQHLLDCAMASQEAGQQDWIHEAMTYISGQWEEGRPIGGGPARKKVAGDIDGNLAGIALTDTKRKDRTNKPLAVAAADRGTDERPEGRVERSTASERQSDKERERMQQREAAYNRAQLKFNPTPVGTAANRIQGLLPLPPLLHPYPTVPHIRSLRHRTVALTRHSADWEKDRERQQEREDELRREERRRGSKHDKHSLSLNSVSGRFPLQLTHLRLVCGYPMPSSSKASQHFIYCSREKRDCTAHLLWEEVEKVRVEQRYWQLSRRLEMLKAELEPVQFRVSERVMCEADVIGQVLGDSLLVEEAEDESMKEEAERMAVLVQRRMEEQDKQTQARAEREKEERERIKLTASTTSPRGHIDETDGAGTAPIAAALQSPLTAAAVAAAAAEAKRAERRSSTDMEVDEHEGFAMSTSVSDLDHASPTHQHHANPPILPTTSYMHASPAVLNSQYGWMAAGMPAPVRGFQHFYTMEPTAAAFVTAAAFGGAQPAHPTATLPPPPPTHPLPLRVQTGGLGSPMGGSPLSTGRSLVGSSSSTSAFSPPGRLAAAAAADTGAAASRSSTSTPSPSSSSPVAAASTQPSSPSKPTTTSALPSPTPPPTQPTQAALAINTNPTIPRMLAPTSLVSPSGEPAAQAEAKANDTKDVHSGVEAEELDGEDDKQLDGTTEMMDQQDAVAQPAAAAVAS